MINSNKDDKDDDEQQKINDLWKNRSRVLSYTHSNIEDRRGQYGGIAIPIRVSKGCHKQWQHGRKPAPAVDRLGRGRVAHLHNIREISH
jgi:hypothetical protein